MKKLFSLVTFAGLLAFTAVAHAGAVGGAKGAETDVEGESIARTVVMFRGGESAIVRVSGDGSSDLDCYAVAPGPVIVARDEGDEDECSLTWVPRATGPVMLVVVNVGESTNKFRLWTN